MAKEWCIGEMTNGEPTNEMTAKAHRRYGKQVINYMVSTHQLSSNQIESPSSVARKKEVYRRTVEQGRQMNEKQESIRSVSSTSSDEMTRRQLDGMTSATPSTK
jgi:hypothetical protein